MPELPEVEVIVRQLATGLPGRRVRAVSGRWAQGVRGLVGGRFANPYRRGKYIACALVDGRTLLVHLGMSGRLILDGEQNERHTHLCLQLDRGTLRFSDPRRFGRVRLCTGPPKEFERLGPEPLDEGLRLTVLARRLKNTKRTIKDALLDQRVIVGLGNIYVGEALFHAGIDPRRRVPKLTGEELGRLVRAAKKVLGEAIERNGTTLRDARFVGADGRAGDNLAALAVYDRAGKPCRHCGMAIVRFVQGGRSSFICPCCQI